jgi:alanine racemase
LNLTRNTYAEINLQNIKENVSNIIKKYNSYEYYFGIVKANCYGHDDIKTVEAIIEGGCNYLAVATLDEALYIREYIKDINILCFGVIPCEHVNKCIENNVTITINSLDYMKELTNKNTQNLKAHIKINTGMNRLGISNVEDVITTINLARNNNITLEGIYTHIYEATNKELYIKQMQKFQDIVNIVNKEDIFEIIHMSASDALSLYEKPDFVNGCRLGIIMYGFTNIKELDLKSTFSLYSEVIQINVINKDETIGYNGIYKAKNEKEKIAVVCIGYADGIIRKNTGRDVYINNKRYPIVGNVCMDMLFVKVDNTINVHDKVTILKDINHIIEVAEHLDTIPYEILCSISKRVERIYKY